MICPHHHQPLRIIHLRDGQRHEFRSCLRCYAEWKESNRVVSEEFEGTVLMVRAKQELERL